MASPPPSNAILVPDGVGRMFLQMLAVIAEFEANLIRMRTRVGMVRASAKGKLKDGKPKLNPRQAAHPRAAPRAGGAKHLGTGRPRTTSGARLRQGQPAAQCRRSRSCALAVLPDN